MNSTKRYSRNVDRLDRHLDQCGHPWFLPAGCLPIAVARLRGRFVRVKTLELHVPDDVALKVAAVAIKHGVTVEELLRLSVDEKLARDAELEAVVSDVLSENAELYKRLA